MQTLQFSDPESLYTVSELNLEAHHLLQNAFGQVWVTGEISNLARPSSGHLYFSLKDAEAQIRCALFRMNHRSAQFILENGQQVIVLAEVSLYQPRGDYQLVVKHVELAGKGALQLAFTELKQKLNAEGLFAAEHKKPIPSLPLQIGVITSSTGAALHDILKVLKRRFASIPVIIYPTQVQGDLAAGQIVHAIKIANQRQECDVLLLARGGGSLEDLWPFNEEVVARAIYASEIPIVSGIGHEVDFTIADFVADVRAPTPSAAAELVSPDTADWLHRLKTLKSHLIQHMTVQLRQSQVQLQHLTQRLRHPGQRLQDQTQRLDQLEQHLLVAMRNVLQRKHAELKHANTTLNQLSPKHTLPLLKNQLQHLQQQLHKQMHFSLEYYRQHLSEFARALDTMSPLHTLERGYAMLQNTAGQLVQTVKAVKPGDQMTARVNDGVITCEVTHCKSIK